MIHPKIFVKKKKNRLYLSCRKGKKLIYCHKSYFETSKIIDETLKVNRIFRTFNLWNGKKIL